MYIGLDLGTSGLKAILITEAQDVVAEANVALTNERPQDGWSEQDPATWLDFLFLMLRLPMGIVTFTVVITAWSLAIGLLLSPISFLFGTFRLDIFFGLWVLHGPFAVMLATLSGVVMVFLAAWITRGLARLEALLASALLDASPEELHRRVTNLARSRARTMSASDQARRRLERDLHEGMSQ